MIEDYHQFSDNNIWSKCQENSSLTNVDTYISKAIIEENKNYYKDEITQRYNSCIINSNCIICDSGTVCTSCQNEFRQDNNIYISNNNENSSKFIYRSYNWNCFWMFWFLLIIAGIIYYFLNKKTIKLKAKTKMI